ncbi:carbohydrate ABC transporter permease [Allostreptomyces psammosilenae]|uniref:Multiple sugar transport system permease protein n=1 Tax=Allostreptomyces psammosilenae TaxID=1892865 RepID=A0A852ZR08_9ACTN|nr:multiple sugar transport system permease protein [Allostreptomyces psammosilenae]
MTATIEQAAPGGAWNPTRRRRTTGSVIWHVAALAALAVVLYPVFWLVSASFKPSDDIIGNLQLLPTSPTFDNYSSAVEGIAGVPVLTFFRNSLIIAVGSVVGTVMSASLAAYAFARIRFRGRGVLFAMMIGTLLLPFHVLMIPQYIIFQRLELINTFVPLLLGKFLATEAFFVFLLVQFMRGLPRELDEAARIDGCGHVRIFWSIMLPLMRPALITASIFSFIWSWNDFLGPLLYLNDPNTFPLSRGLQLFIDQQSNSDYGAMIAMSMLALLPVMLFFLAFQRYLVDGVATEGLKG